MWVLWQPLGAKGLLRSGLPQLYASGPASQAIPVSSWSPPVPHRAAHQAHREQRGTGDHFNCPCFGRLSGKAAWRGGPRSQACPQPRLRESEDDIYLSALRVHCPIEEKPHFQHRSSSGVGLWPALHPRDSSETCGGFDCMLNSVKLSWEHIEIHINILDSTI